MPVADNVADYAVNLAASTRPGRDRATAEVNQYLSWVGTASRTPSSPQKSTPPSTAYSPDIEDVPAVATPILRHRIARNYKRRPTA